MNSPSTTSPDSASWDLLLHNANLATLDAGSEDGIGLIAKGAIAIQGSEIVWVGTTSELSEADIAQVANTIDCQGKLVTPGLIDCHTHLVHAGNRAAEFEMRLNGASYEEISRAGGGIVSTVKATRAASEEELFESASRRLKDFLSEGVTTIEVKSGYGLDLENELKMLRVARRLGDELPIDVVTSFLGAHAVPEEFEGDTQAYIDHVCEVMLPRVAQYGLADAVDGFCETIAFSRQQIEQVFDAANEHGLDIKLHAEQLSDMGGAAMAASRGALSVDHLEYLKPEDVPILANNNTVAVILPGAFYFLRETQLPPFAALREHKVPMAIASDNNPGSSPVQSLLLMLNMACTLFQLTPSEAFKGVTIHAAQALKLEKKVGSLSIGKLANLVLWDVKNVADLCYPIGANPCLKTIYHGKQR